MLKNTAVIALTFTFESTTLEDGRVYLMPSADTLKRVNAFAANQVGEEAMAAFMIKLFLLQSAAERGQRE